MSYRDLYIQELNNCLLENVAPDCSMKEAFDLTSTDISCYISQLIIGDYAAFTAVYAVPEVLNAFATAYAGFDVTDDVRDEIIGDFLNLINGKFAVALSNSRSVECTLSVPEFTPIDKVKLHESSYVIPVEFSFGIVNFIFSE